MGGVKVLHPPASSSSSSSSSFEQALAALPRTSMARLAARLRAGLVSLCRPLLCAQCGEKWGLFARRSDKQLPLGALCEECQVAINSDRRLKDATTPCSSSSSSSPSSGNSSDEELDVVSVAQAEMIKPDVKRVPQKVRKSAMTPRKRAASQSPAASLVTLSEAIVRPRLASEPIITPAYRLLTPPNRARIGGHADEFLVAEQEALRKHARYEQKEKTCNLLRPGVYTSLIARYQTRQRGKPLVSKRHWGV